ncbi:unnamed protein product [Boreogadus saida]
MMVGELVAYQSVKKGALATLQYSTCDMVQYCKYSRYSLSRVESRELKTYLFSSRNVLIMDETVKQLRLGWTLPSFPHSQAMVYSMTWSTKVALMS